MFMAKGKARTANSMIAYHHAHPGHFRKVPAGRECTALWFDMCNGVAVALFQDGWQTTANISAFELLSHWDKKRAYLEESIDNAVKISSIRDKRPAVIEMHPDSINL